MPKTVATLALLFELIDGGRAEVNEVATARALDWADYLRTHANRLYSSGEMIMVEDGAKLIIGRRHNLPGQFTVRDIHQKSWAGFGDIATVKAAIQMLTCTNHCREVVVESPVNASGGRPPSTKYCWNPRLDEKEKG